MKQDQDEEMSQTPGPCWPFWGMLETIELGRHGIPGRPDRLRRTIVFSGATHDVFNRFNSIGRKALGMLGRRSIEELSNSAREIQAAIDETRDRYVDEETESLIKSLSEHGGYQSHYLPDGAHGTADEYRDLLENWSGEFDDSSGLPVASDMSQLDALCGHLDADKNDESALYRLGLCEPDDYEFYAVLTLMIVCDVDHSYPRPRYPNSESLSQVTAIGHAAIEAIEALAFAESIQLHRTIRRSIEAGQPAILAAEIDRRDQERAAAQKRRLSRAGEKGAEAKHRKHAELKSWALAKAVDMRDDDVTIARKLSAKLPVHLADVSKNPERLIYDALRAKRITDSYG